MFTGYGFKEFFTYKGVFREVFGYSGQDYDGPGRMIYLGVSIALVILLCILFRKAKHEHIKIYLRVLGIVMLAMNIGKFAWETYFDIASGEGFNIYILPFDTCSIVVWAALLAGFAKGPFKLSGETWLATIGIAGGISNLLFLQALKYYPFFTFGAFYSMIWHFVMVFTGFFLVVAGYVELNFKTVLTSFILHMIISVPVIILDYAQGIDFMLYLSAGGVPVFEGIAEKLNGAGLNAVTTLMMVAVYFGVDAMLVYLFRLVRFLYRLASKKLTRKTA